MVLVVVAMDIVEVVVGVLLVEGVGVGVALIV